MVFIHHDYDGQPDHLGGHGFMTNMDEPLLDFLIERFGVTEFIDLGCGEGGMVRAARARGLWAMGIDGDPKVCPDFLQDFTEPIDPVRIGLIDRLYLYRTDDPYCKLVWCVEFVEHVEREYIPNYLPVFACADVCFISHALPGQGGHHHVSEMQNDEMMGYMSSIGFVRDEEATFTARDIAVNRYTKTTGMVFVRQENPQGASAKEES